ncbi:M20/M25/M40 family metallo-hydrolase [Candidatus Poribacteria bacterium]|nr:M20/M25/M40 family metallo-hydrolase [Candidatus Poribacteria bacterium]
MRLKLFIFIICFFLFNFSIHIYAQKQPDTIEITAVGDIAYGLDEKPFVDKYGYDYLFDSTLSLLQNTDISIGNIKTAFSLKGSPRTPKNFLYSFPPEAIKSFKNAGFDVISFASNHFGDFGEEATLETFDIFSSTNIIYIGAGRNIALARELKTSKIKSTKIGFLSYSDKGIPDLFATQTTSGTLQLTMDYFKSDIENAKKNVDILVVSVHWGDAYTNITNNKQIITARNMIDFGADIILGHYPHVLQGIEVYNGRIIAYSLGTFSFGEYFTNSQNVRDGMILKFKIIDKKIDKVTIIPLNVDNEKIKFQPQIQRGQSAQKIIENLQSYSSEFYTKINEKNGYGYIDLSNPYKRIQFDSSMLNYLSAFDINRVLEHIKFFSINIGSRPQGTDAEKKAFQYIKQNLSTYGYEIEEQEYKIENSNKSYNIVAKKEYFSYSPIIIIGAHVDSVPMGPGANDNASGAATLLEVARIVQKAKIDKNILFVFFGAEEGTQNFSLANSFGSRHFVRKLKYETIKKIIGMMSVDMVGYGKNFYIGNMQRGSDWFASWMRFQALQLGYATFPFNANIGSDHSAFEIQGVPVAYLEWYKDPNYHTSDDTLDKIQVQNLEITGQVIIASILNL